MKYQSYTLHYRQGSRKRVSWGHLERQKMSLNLDVARDIDVMGASLPIDHGQYEDACNGLAHYDCAMMYSGQSNRNCKV